MLRALLGRLLQFSHPEEAPYVGMRGAAEWVLDRLALGAGPVWLVDGSNLFYTLQFTTSLGDADEPGEVGEVLLIMKRETLRFLRKGPHSLEEAVAVLALFGKVHRVTIHIPRCRERHDACLRKEGRKCTLVNDRRASRASHLHCEYDDVLLTLLYEALRARGTDARFLSRDRRVLKRVTPRLLDRLKGTITHVA